MKYTDLSLDHKKEFLVNAKALYMACALLAEVTKDDSVPQGVWQAAYTKIASMSEEEIEETVQNLEFQHKPFNQPGRPVAVNLALIDMDV